MSSDTRAIRDELRAFLEHQTGVRWATVSESASGSLEIIISVVDTPTGLPRGVLPDGREVTELNPYETRYLYEEIFEGLVYAPPGMELPPRPLILDVGANIGLFAMFAATWAVEPRIVAFEPSPEAFAALTANGAEHDLPVAALPWAIGGADG